MWDSKPIFNCVEQRTLWLAVEQGDRNYCRISSRYCTKKKFFIKDFFSKCDQIHRKLWIWSHLLEISLMENFIFCAVTVTQYRGRYSVQGSEGFQCVEVKSQCILKCLQIQGNSRYRHFWFCNISSDTHIHLWEIGSLQPRGRSLLYVLDHEKRYIFHTFCLIDLILKMIQLDQATLKVVTSEWKTRSC